MGELDSEEHRLLEKLGDHDLIVSLHIKMNHIIDTAADHETRLRNIEGGYVTRTAMAWLFGAIVGAATALSSILSALKGR